MKKADIRKLKTIVVPNEEEYKIPDGWVLLKDPTKITENGVDVFKCVIGAPA